MVKKEQIKKRSEFKIISDGLVDILTLVVIGLFCIVSIAIVFWGIIGVGIGVYSVLESCGMSDCIPKPVDVCVLGVMVLLAYSVLICCFLYLSELEDVEYKNKLKRFKK